MSKNVTELDLQARLKASLSQPDVSFLKRDKPKAEVTPIADIREVINSPADRVKLLRLSSQSLMYAKLESDAKKARKPIVGSIKEIVSKYSGKMGLKFTVGDAVTSYYNSPRTRINTTKLLAHGISPTVIQACTDTEDCWQLRITAPGEKEEEE